MCQLLSLENFGGKRQLQYVKGMKIDLIEFNTEENIIIFLVDSTDESGLFQ
jgi:hypothetical protein